MERCRLSAMTLTLEDVAGAALHRARLCSNSALHPLKSILLSVLYIKRVSTITGNMSFALLPRKNGIAMKHTARTCLIEERKYRKWSQQEVADRIGTTPNNVSRWELGQTTPGPYFCAKLCTLFGKNAQELELVDWRPARESSSGNLSHVLLAQGKTSFVPRNPYKGLRAFREEDTQDFFGRDSLIEETLALLGQMLQENQLKRAPSRLLTVVGPSGSGKSSLVMAGVVPRLHRDALPGSQNWLYLDPMVPGAHPLEALTTTLASLFPARTLTSLREDLDASARSLHALLATHRPPSKGHILLLIDQFEELFAQTETEHERQHFLDLLLTAVMEPSGPLIAIIVLRADFYDRPLQYPALGALFTTSQVLVLPMEVRDVRAAIEQPAQLPDVQIVFEDGLVDEVLFEVQGQIGALPLLQFTLDQLFQQRQGQVCTLHSYREMGGVRGALARQAESLYQSLPSPVHQRLARALFLRLINPSTVEQEVTRRRVPFTELVMLDSEDTDRLAAVTWVFTEARLLTTNMTGRVATIEVSHEALLHAWPRLQEWLHEARDAVRVQRALREDAAEWLRQGQPPDQLYQGSRLTKALNWRADNLPSRDEDLFLQASQEAQQRAHIVLQQQRRRTTRRRVLGGIATLAALSGTGLLGELLGSLKHASSGQRFASSPPYSGHTRMVTCVAWSPADGTLLASASVDRTVRIWDTSSGQSLFTYQQHQQPVYSVAWSPDGTHIASASADQAVRVWDANSGVLRCVYYGHAAAVYSVAWSPDGTRIASAGADQTVQVWDATNGRLLFPSYTGHTDTVYSVAWSPDGTRIASAGADQTVQVWVPQNSHVLLCFLHSGVVRCVAWSPNGTHIASASDNQMVQIWDAINGGLSFPPYTGHTAAVYSVAWSPDGKLLASAGFDRTVQIWVAEREDDLLGYLLTAQEPNAVQHIAWSPDGRHIALANADATIQMIDIDQGHPLFPPIDLTASLANVAWSPDGQLLAAVSIDATVQIWDANKGRPFFISPGHRFQGETAFGGTVAWSSDGQLLAAAGPDQSVRIWSKGSFSPSDYPVPVSVRCVAWAPGSYHLAIVDADEMIWLWDVTADRTSFYTPHTAAITSVAWSPDGTYLASASADQTVQIYNVTAHTSFLTYTGHRGALPGLLMGHALPQPVPTRRSRSGTPPVASTVSSIGGITTQCVAWPGLPMAGAWLPRAVIVPCSSGGFSQNVAPSSPHCRESSGRQLR